MSRRFVVGDSVQLTVSGQEYMRQRSGTNEAYSKELVGEVTQAGAVVIHAKGFLSNPEARVAFFNEHIRRIVPPLKPGTPIRTAGNLFIFGMDEVPAGSKGVISHWTGSDYNVILVGRGMAMLGRHKFEVDEAALPKVVEKPVVVVEALKVRIGDVLKDETGKKFVVDMINANNYEATGVAMAGADVDGGYRRNLYVGKAEAVARAEVVDVWARDE